MNGVGNYDAPDLESQTATVDVSGAGGVVIRVLNALDVAISGAGNVDYFGSPTVTQDISGAGRLTSRGDK